MKQWKELVGDKAPLPQRPRPNKSHNPPPQCIYGSALISIKSKLPNQNPFCMALSLSLSLSVCMCLWSGCIHNWTTTHHGTAATPTHEPNQNTNSSIKLQNISSFSIIFNTPIANHHGNQTTTRRRTYIYYYWYGLVPPDINALNFLLEFLFLLYLYPIGGLHLLYW